MTCIYSQGENQGHMKSGGDICKKNVLMYSYDLKKER